MFPPITYNKKNPHSAHPSIIASFKGAWLGGIGFRQKKIERGRGRKVQGKIKEIERARDPEKSEGEREMVWEDI